VRRSSSRAGFTLVEVAISIGILGVAIAALMNGTYLATSNNEDVRNVTRATLLARAVMAEIEQRLIKDGFPMNDRDESCDFRIEGLRGFACEYSVRKVELPIGDILPRLMGGGGDGVGADGKGEAGKGTPGTPGSPLAGSPLGAAPPGSTPMGPGGLAQLAQGALGANPSLAANAIQLYAGQMQSMLEEALREVRLTLSWKTGPKTAESLSVVTHLVEIGRAGVSGQDQAAGQISGQFGLQAPVPGQAQPGMPGMPGMPGIPGMPGVPGMGLPGLTRPK
jgi:general secretion pathway protein I